MKLRGTDFGRVLDASGVRGFACEGYKHHRLLKPFGLRFNGSVPVFKTVTLHPRQGGMPPESCYGLKQTRWKPKSIYVTPRMARRGYALNAVQLANPGIGYFLKSGIWRRFEQLFVISLAAVGATFTEHMNEWGGLISFLERYQHHFNTPFGLQLNMSCPNVHAPEIASLFVQEVLQVLSLFHGSTLEMPIMVKLSVEVPPETALRIAAHPECDALCVSNALPWGALPEHINWKALFRSRTSPLEDLGGGGLSGAPLLPLVVEWLYNFRALEREKSGASEIPINAGGGILSARDADALFNAGASSIFIGSVSFLRPWRVPSIIASAQARACTL